MMMPANYSVIAENEMTYVNWKKFNTNLVMIIGNGFMGNFLKSTVETLFGSKYVFGDVVTGIGNTLASTATEGGSKVTANGVVRAALQIVGGLASIYSLGQGDVPMALPKDYVMPIV